jgi:hypothetical protein
MRIRLDENLGGRIQKAFVDAGHEVETVRGEKLSGCDDETIFAKCCAEKRCLVTLDLDFADPIRFGPARCSGIIVIRSARRGSGRLLLALVNELLTGLTRLPFDRDLWIVEPGRIRVHQKESDELAR